MRESSRTAVGIAHMPIGFRAELADTVTFPVIQPPSLKHDKIDDRKRPEPVGFELPAQAAYDAGVPEMDIERRIAENRAGIVCPSWCVVKHDDIYEEYVRECASATEELKSLTHQSISAAAVRFTDLVSGEVRAPNLRVGDDTMTLEIAVQLADQIMVAAAVANTGSVREVYDAVNSVVPLAKYELPAETYPGCEPWCVALEDGVACGGVECHTKGVEQPATAGFWQHHEQGMRCAMVETYAFVTESGDVAVDLRVAGPVGLHDSREAWAHLTPAEARRIGRALLAQADIAEQGTSR